MSVARFIADQRTLYRVPVAFTCALLGVSVSWFYKWRDRGADQDAAAAGQGRRGGGRGVRARRGLHGSPRLYVDLREKGWTVSEKTVADSMRRQGLVARIIKRRSGLTRQDKTAAKFPDLVRRDFTAAAIERPSGSVTSPRSRPRAGKLYLATVIDLYSRRLLGAATSAPPRRGAGRCGDQDGDRGPRRQASHRPGRLPHRQRARPTPPTRSRKLCAVTRDPPVDGPGRLVPVNRPIGPLASGCLRWAVVGIAVGVVEVGAARE